MLPIVLFCASAALGLYIVAGYPLLLGLMARLWPKPVFKSRQRKTVSVGDRRPRWGAIHRRQARFRAGPRLSARADGNPGGLRWLHRPPDAIVQEFAARGVRLLRVPRGGKCAALNAAIPQARNEILLLTDIARPWPRIVSRR
ncbi:MAG: hypothetical protein ABSG03_26860 [Bryobacteraceae bacterium]